MEQPLEQLTKQSVQTSKKVWWIIIAIVATAIIVGGGIYFWQSSIVKQIKSRLMIESQNLQQQVQNLQNQLAAQADVEVSKTDEESSQWQKIHHGFYTFDIPTNWKVDFLGAGTGYGMSGMWGWPVFIDENGNVVAEMHCPIVETGYEGVTNLSNQSRLIDLPNSRDYYNSQGKKVPSGQHQIGLSMGEFGGNFFGRISLSPVEKDNHNNELVSVDYYQTCEILSINLVLPDNINEIYNHIYESIEAAPLQ